VAGGAATPCAAHRRNEAWKPNVAVATERLRPLGVEVIRVEAAPDNVEQSGVEARGALPFASGSFSLVVNRHEAFLAREVARVLAPGGVFVTQQMGGRYDDFYELLGASPPPARPFRLALAIEQLEAAELTVVDAAEADAVTWFNDVGALVWYLRAIPWIVPGFTVAAHRARLAELHARIAAEGPVAVRQPAFWLEARKSRTGSG
jgi:SAM-dependent methyltransferase